jgi:hypothetical protein
MSLAGFAAWLQATSLSITLQSHAWVVPTLQSLHILMIGVVFVSIVAVALRVLGWFRADESLAQVWRRFAPFLWTGVAVMACTGLLLTISEPVRELTSVSFRIKIPLVAFGVIVAATFARFVARAARSGAVVATAPGARLPVGMRLAAIATVLLWLVIIFLGRAIAYDEAIWGKHAVTQLDAAG